MRLAPASSAGRSPACAVESRTVGLAPRRPPQDQFAFSGFDQDPGERRPPCPALGQCGRERLSQTFEPVQTNSNGGRETPNLCLQQAQDNFSRRLKHFGGVKAHAIVIVVDTGGSHCRLRVKFQRRRSSPRAPAQTRQRRPVQSLLSQQGRQTPYPGAREFFMGVGRVGQKRMSRLPANLFEIGFRRLQEGPRQRHRAAGSDVGHPRQTGDASSPRQSKEDGFGLIVGVVGGNNRLGSDCRRAVDEQGVSRVARPLLNARGGFFPRPDQMMVLKAKGSRPVADESGFGAGAGAQAVIDGGDFDPALGAASPLRRHKHQRHRVRPSGNGEQDGVILFQKIEGGRRRQGPGSACQHWVFLLSRSTASRKRPSAAGYLTPISLKAAQACSFAPRAASD